MRKTLLAVVVSLVLASSLWATPYPTYIVNGDMSTSVTSIALPITRADGYSIQASWTGASAAGTLSLQASNDTLVWDPIGGTSYVVAGPGTLLWNMGPAYYPYVEVIYVPTSGAGTLNATAFVKDGE